MDQPLHFTDIYKKRGWLFWIFFASGIVLFYFAFTGWMFWIFVALWVLSDLFVWMFLAGFARVLSYGRFAKIWLKLVNDPVNNAVKEIGGRFSSAHFFPLMWMHLMTLSVCRSAVAKAHGIKPESISLEFVQNDAKDAATLSPMEKRYLIYITSALFVDLYERFTRLVLKEPHTTSFRDHLEGTASANVRRAAKTFRTVFQGTEASTMQAALITTLVQFALEFIVFHEMGHVVLGHVESLEIASEGISLSEVQTNLDREDRILQNRLEIEADDFAATYSLEIVRRFGERNRDEKARISAVDVVFPFASNDELSTYWAFSICTLLLIIEPDRSLGNFDADDHPFLTLRLDPLLQRASEVFGAASSSITWKTFFVKFAPWFEASGVSAAKVIALAEAFEKSGAADRLTRGLEDQSIVDQMLANYVRDGRRVQANIVLGRRNKEIAAYARLQEYVLLIRGTDESILSNPDLGYMRQTRDFKTLAESQEIRRSLETNLTALIDQSLNYRTKVLLCMLAQHQGLSVPNKFVPRV